MQLSHKIIFKRKNNYEIGKEDGKIIKQIEKRKKNYDNLSNKEQEDFWKVLDMIEIFVDNLNYPMGLIDTPIKITEL